MFTWARRPGSPGNPASRVSTLRVLNHEKYVECSLAYFPLAAPTLASASILIISVIIPLRIARKQSGSVINCNSAFLEGVAVDESFDGLPPMPNWERHCTLAPRPSVVWIKGSKTPSRSTTSRRSTRSYLLDQRPGAAEHRDPPAQQGRRHLPLSRSYVRLTICYLIEYSEDWANVCSYIQEEKVLGLTPRAYGSSG